MLSGDESMKLKKEFDDFYKAIRIDSETARLKEKREILEKDIKSNLPGILANHGINISSTDIRMIYQGSYKYNTTIKSDVVDSDIAVMIPLTNYSSFDTRKLKGYLRDSINIPSRTVTIKEPCVTASYFENGKEWLHIDLPLYAKSWSTIYLARGKEHSNSWFWEEADPDGLNDYLCDKINGHDQLRRIICFIKKWRNEKYASSTKDHEIPPSIGLTLLACDCFSPQTTNDGDDDLSSLQKTMRSIKDMFSVTSDYLGNVIEASISKYLPVSPYTDVFKKMKDSSNSYMVTFYNRLSAAVEDLTNAINVESSHDAGKYVQKVLGTDFVIPKKEAVTSNTLNRREHSFG